MTTAVRAVLVEDSAVQAAALIRMLEAEGDILVVATASDARAAADAVARHRPDVVTVDLEISGTGQRAIEQIMADTPTPILVVSGGVDPARAAAPAMQALAAGAVEALPKPEVWEEGDARELRRQVRRVSRIPVIRRRGWARGERPPRTTGRAVATDGVIAVAASTGGPAALATLLKGIAREGVPILLVQHIHAAFADGFAEWLSTVSGVDAVIARDGGRMTAGRAHVAPGGCHLRLGPRGRLEVSAEPETLQRPSADVLFRSVARHGGRRSVGILLTGMGDDGAEGLLAMRAAGARTFAQDEATSAVFGMPRAAQRIGAAEAVLALDELAAAVREALRRPR